MIEAFPLHWPTGQPRVPAHLRRTDYSCKLSAERYQRDLRTELRLMGAADVVVSTNVPLRKRDGLMYSDVEPGVPAAAVYFTHGKRHLVIACDSYTQVRWNLRACFATVEALRTIKRHGATELLERAFTGFTALPPKGGEVRPWWEVLGVERTATKDQVRDAYLVLAQQHHPDKGGDQETMTRINRAYEEATGRAAL
jgi:hypothetical protein